MNTMIVSARRALVVSLFSVGLAAASFAANAQPQFIGPRNTIRHESPRAQDRPFDDLRASTRETDMCDVVRFEHKGHPSKGYTRVVRVPASCNRSHLSAR